MGWLLVPQWLEVFAANKGQALQLVVFLAILLHKAPTAFSLVTFMLAQNHSIRKIRIALLLFSIAAPIFASLTFYLVDSISSNVDVLSRITGLILLFSGGSFLYVSTVHVLPKVAEHGRLTNWKLILIISGIFTPFLLTIAHVIGYNLALIFWNCWVFSINVANFMKNLRP